MSGKKNQNQKVVKAVVSEEPIGKFAGMEGKCAICGHTIFQGQAGEIGHTCKAHLGKTSNYLPAPVNPANNPDFIPLKELCDFTESKKLGRGLAVSLSGGDAGMKPIANPVMQIFVFGKRKYCKKEALAWLQTYVSKLPVK